MSIYDIARIAEDKGREGRHVLPLGSQALARIRGGSMSNLAEKGVTRPQSSARTDHDRTI
jgi:hypothetical protein